MSNSKRDCAIVALVFLAVGAAAGSFAKAALRPGCAERRDAPLNAGVRETVRAPDRRADVKPAVDPGELERLRGKVESLEGELKEVMSDDGKKGKDASSGAAYNVYVDGCDDDVRLNCKTFGEWKRLYPKHWKRNRDRFVKEATQSLEKCDKWQRAISSLDTSWMTEDELSVHERLQQTFAQMQELVRENMRDDDDMTIERCIDNSTAIDRLYKEGLGLVEEERANLLGVVSENLGKQLGWRDEDILECADMLQAISEATSKGIQR